MNQLLDVQAELDHLERCLEDYLSPQLLETSRTVLDTLRIRPDQKPRWTERLSPFVVLYPLLQSQAWSERPTDTARTANVVHLFLLMHTFIDDRLIDNQHPLAPEEIVLAKQAALGNQRARARQSHSRSRESPRSCLRWSRRTGSNVSSATTAPNSLTTRDSKTYPQTWRWKPMSKSSPTERPSVSSARWLRPMLRGERTYNRHLVGRSTTSPSVCSGRMT